MALSAVEVVALRGTHQRVYTILAAAADATADLVIVHGCGFEPNEFWIEDVDAAVVTPNVTSWSVHTVGAANCTVRRVITAAGAGSEQALLTLRQTHTIFSGRATMT